MRRIVWGAPVLVVALVSISVGTSPVLAAPPAAEPPVAVTPRAAAPEALRAPRQAVPSLGVLAVVPLLGVKKESELAPPVVLGARTTYAGGHSLEVIDGSLLPREDRIYMTAGRLSTTNDACLMRPGIPPTCGARMRWMSTTAISYVHLTFTVPAGKRMLIDCQFVNRSPPPNPNARLIAIGSSSSLLGLWRTPVVTTNLAHVTTVVTTSGELFLRPMGAGTPDPDEKPWLDNSLAVDLNQCSLTTTL